MESCFPSDQFSASAYRASSADLESFSDEELVKHYNTIFLISLVSKFISSFFNYYYKLSLYSTLKSKLFQFNKFSLFISTY